MALTKDEMHKLVAALGNMQYQVVGHSIKVNLQNVVNILEAYTDGTYDLIPHIGVEDDGPGYVKTSIAFELKDKGVGHGSESK